MQICPGATPMSLSPEPLKPVFEHFEDSGPPLPDLDDGDTHTRDSQLDTGLASSTILPPFAPAGPAISPATQAQTQLPAALISSGTPVSRFIEDLPEYRPYRYPSSPHKRQPRSPILLLRRRTRSIERAEEVGRNKGQRGYGVLPVPKGLLRWRRETVPPVHASTARRAVSMSLNPQMHIPAFKPKPTKLKKRPPKRVSPAQRGPSYAAWRRDMLVTLHAQVSRRSSTRSASTTGAASSERALLPSSGRRGNVYLDKDSSRRRRCHVLALVKRLIRCGHVKVRIE